MPNGDGETEPTYDQLLAEQAFALSRDRYLLRANLRATLNPGDHERKGGRAYEGRCAACGDGVLEDEARVIRYHPTQPGGIFHHRCAPTGPQWYGIGEGE